MSEELKQGLDQMDQYARRDMQGMQRAEQQLASRGNLLEIFIQARMCYESLRQGGPRTKKQMRTDPIALALARIMNEAEKGLGLKLARPDRKEG